MLQVFMHDTDSGVLTSEPRISFWPKAGAVKAPRFRCQFRKKSAHVISPQEPRVYVRSLSDANLEIDFAQACCITDIGESLGKLTP
jgi:hypothetical protein